MYKIGNASNSANSKSKTNRDIAHSRIDDEEIIYKKYELGRKLGQGSFGVVYELKNRDTNHKFAIKIINKEKGGKSSITFENEVLIMKSVTHQNLIKLEEVFETKKKLYLITELCEAGELGKWIKKQGPIPEMQSKIIMRQIVDAISYLHKNDIVHRDLKLENILIKEFGADSNSDNFLIKVTDFGLSNKRDTVGTDSMFEEYCGTPLYMAPEIIDNFPYSQLCDVWALGIIMFFLLTSHSPFTADSESKLRDQIRKAEIDVHSNSYARLSPEAKDCIERMIKINPAFRITSNELQTHPWFLDKKLHEINNKNVLELMSEMLHEQENDYQNMITSRINENIVNGEKLETLDSYNSNTVKSKTKDALNIKTQNLPSKASNTRPIINRTDRIEKRSPSLYTNTKQKK